MKKDVKEFDTYSIQKNGIVSDFDLKVLIRLYQPIIGYTATSLYLTLLNENSLSPVVATNRTHKRLFALMQINKTDFLLARKKLESIGLLNTKIKENENKIALDYLYALQSPKTPNDFFNDTVLNSLLLKSLGEDEFYRTQYFYSDYQPQNDDYIDISSSFEESFVIKPASIKNLSQHYSEKVTKNVVSNLNMDAFVVKMTEHLIPKSLFTSAVKKEIARVKMLFDLNEKQLENCVLSSIQIDENQKKKINLMLFNQEAEKCGQSTPVLEQPKDETSDLFLFAKHLDDSDPYDYYKGLLHIPSLFKNDLYLIKQLQDAKMTSGMINAVLYYCVKNKKSDYNFNGYVQKVASSVIKEKCQNAYQVLNYLKKALVRKFDKKEENVFSSATTIEDPINDEFEKALNEWGK
ncbi:replication initiation/membrane attachment protein [Firmicutes bacterium CAG:631]|nr:replication initiation/membrane attachment protein [Firmicutes bacterium CAG:631]